MQELVNYIARELAEDARTAFIRPFQDALLSGGDDVDRKRKTITLVLGAVKGLGTGSDRGECITSTSARCISPDLMIKSPSRRN